MGFKGILVSILGQGLVDVATDITNNYMDPKYKSIVTFVAVNMMLKFYHQEHLTDPNKRVDFDYLDYCIIPKFVIDPNYVVAESELAGPNGNNVIVVGPSIKDCLSSDCITMPYDVILDNNFDKFVSTIETAMGAELDSEQMNFVQKNFDTYYTSQSPGLMSNPFKYYQDLGQAARQQIMALKGM